MGAMNWAVLLVGVAAGLAVAFGRVYAENVVAKRYGLAPQLMFKHRDVLVPFLALATAANVYGVWITVAYGGLASLRLSAVLGLALLLAAQLLQLHIALRPLRRDLDLALKSCAPYVYLFALSLAALALNSYTLWVI